MPKPQEGQELIKPKTDFSNLILPGILIGLVLVIIFVLIMNYNNSNTSNQVQDSLNNQSQTNNDSFVEELIIEDLQEGDGDVVQVGDTATFHYVGTLKSDDSQFDSSRDRDQPFTTQIGVGQVIKGWDQGIPGMRVGGVRRLTIPYELAYGEQGTGDAIPPRSDLVFEVELLDIE